MERTVSVGAELNKALAAAQAEMRNPGLERTNGAFKGSRYADLAAVRAAVIPVFAKHGLAVCQVPVVGQGTAGVETHLLHCSGEERPMGTLLLPVSKPDAHGYGSAITYARRYALQSIACVVGDDDDDGNGAVGISAGSSAGGNAPGTPAQPNQEQMARAKAAAANLPKASQQAAAQYTAATAIAAIQAAPTLPALIALGESFRGLPAEVRAAAKVPFEERLAALGKA